jgi:hypothetical protein
MDPKTLIYTTILTSIYQHTDLFEVEGWKKRGKEMLWKTLIVSRAKLVAGDALEILTRLAEKVDDFENHLTLNSNLAASMGAHRGEENMRGGNIKILSKVKITDLWRFVGVLLLDRLYYASEKDPEPVCELVQFEHPLLRFEPLAIKSEKFTKALLQTTAEELYSNISYFLEIPEASDLGYLPGASSFSYNVPPPTGSIAEVKGSGGIHERKNGPTDDEEKNEEYHSASIHQTLEEEIETILDKATSFGSMVIGGLMTNVRTDINRVAGNLWMLAASCFYVSQVRHRHIQMKV